MHRTPDRGRRLGRGVPRRERWAVLAGWSARRPPAAGGTGEARDDRPTRGSGR
ncbi:hypothetical protein [Halomarina ordinaria]|uniref:Uncharacterized protein n=1 Tax=Halomarina ordinaria TaxID=3033939 RepID=A0ABD5U3I8_9EURY|nr:hypothetical protein [Halomarina sp. PSRA2]